MNLQLIFTEDAQKIFRVADANMFLRKNIPLPTTLDGSAGVTEQDLMHLWEIGSFVTAILTVLDLNVAITKVFRNETIGDADGFVDTAKADHLNTTLRKLSNYPTAANNASLRDWIRSTYIPTYLSLQRVWRDTWLLLTGPKYAPAPTASIHTQRNYMLMRFLYESYPFEKPFQEGCLAAYFNSNINDFQFYLDEWTEETFKELVHRWYWQSGFHEYFNLHLYNQRTAADKKSIEKLFSTSREIKFTNNAGVMVNIVPVAPSLKGGSWYEWLCTPTITFTPPNQKSTMVEKQLSSILWKLFSETSVGVAMTTETYLRTVENAIVGGLAQMDHSQESVHPSCMIRLPIVNKNSLGFSRPVQWKVFPSTVTTRKDLAELFPADVKDVVVSALESAQSTSPVDCLTGLLSRFYSIRKGEISTDKVRLREWLRKHMAKTISPTATFPHWIAAESKSELSPNLCSLANEMNLHLIAICIDSPNDTLKFHAGVVLPRPDEQQLFNTPIQTESMQWILDPFYRRQTLFFGYSLTQPGVVTMELNLSIPPEEADNVWISHLCMFRSSKEFQQSIMLPLMMYMHQTLQSISEWNIIKQVFFEKVADKTMESYMINEKQWNYSLLYQHLQQQIGGSIAPSTKMISYYFSMEDQVLKTSTVSEMFSLLMHTRQTALNTMVNSAIQKNVFTWPPVSPQVLKEMLNKNGIAESTFLQELFTAGSDLVANSRSGFRFRQLWNGTSRDIYMGLLPNITQDDRQLSDANIAFLKTMSNERV